MFKTHVAKLLGFLLIMVAVAMPMGASATVIVQGTLDLHVDQFQPGAFGLSAIPSAPFQAHFRLAYVGGGTPDPAEFPALLEDFDFALGNAQWDETLPHSGLKVLEAGGLIQGIELFITYTTPHPDLSFFLPASPGQWEAHDLIGSVDNGTIGGTYQITAQVVPEPPMLPLVLTGLLGLGWMVGHRIKKST
jgi:hypothetical protein